MLYKKIPLPLMGEGREGCERVLPACREEEDQGAVSCKPIKQARQKVLYCSRVVLEYFCQSV